MRVAARVIVALAGSATILTGFAATATAQERAGETLRVQASSYQSTGGYPLDLHRGDAIFRNASVYTKDTGSLKMLFDDGTDMTLGPNTEIVIDDYVYAPDAGTGQAAISLGRGVLRLVSGRMPSSGISVDTPVATIGLRGTDVTLATGGPGVLGWVADGAVVAAPDQSDQTFTFTAPVTFACSGGGCQQTEGQGPPPPAFGPPGDGGGPGNTSDPEGNDESPDHDQ